MVWKTKTGLHSPMYSQPVLTGADWEVHRADWELGFPGTKECDWCARVLGLAGWVWGSAPSAEGSSLGS